MLKKEERGEDTELWSYHAAFSCGQKDASQPGQAAGTGGFKHQELQVGSHQNSPKDCRGPKAMELRKTCRRPLTLVDPRNRIGHQA